MAASPTIRLPDEVRTERLVLRRWRADDAEPLAAIYRQPEFLEHMPSKDLEQTRAQIERFERHWEEEGFGHWAAELDGRLVGRIGLLRQRDWPLGGAPVEVGWTLDRAVWGHGLATEGGRASLGLWRDLLWDDAQLISITRPGNFRSRAVMTRLGLTYRGDEHWRGYDVVWHALDRRPQTV